MLGKSSHSVIGRLSELLVPGGRSLLLESPLDPLLLRDVSENHQNPSPNNKAANNKNNDGSRNFDLGRHGVGLGIVVALEKPSSQFSSFGSGGGTGPRPKYFICSPEGHSRSEQEGGSAEKEEEEDYTYVTFHGPRVSFTMVYHDQIEKERSEVEDRDGSRDVQGFLSCCQLCGKLLHGQDIYMYRGDKGFCSTECRSAQIMTDERREQCRSEVSDTWSHSSSVAFSEGQVFPTSILAV